MKPASCPCCSGKAYDLCCAPFLLNNAAPETCEQLMRSRYSAYAAGAINYLVETTHPSKRNKGLARSIEASMENMHWTKLEVLSTSSGLAEDQIGKVEFIAHYEESDKPGQSNQLHELSRFRRFEGKWVYLDGELYA